MRPKQRDGQVLAVFSPKGGVGCTTIATNLAVAIKQEAGMRVALADGSLPFGNVGVFLDLAPSHSIMDLQVPSEQMDADFVETALVTHERSGIKVLLAPQRPEMADMVTGELLRRTIGLLRERNEYVVVDTWSTLDERVLTALEAVPIRSYWSCRWSSPASRAARFSSKSPSCCAFRPRKSCYSSRGPTRRRRHRGEHRSDAGAPSDVRIPSDERVARSINEGDPLTLSARNTPVAHAISDLARRFVAKNYPELNAVVGEARPGAPPRGPLQDLRPQLADSSQLSAFSQ